MAQNREKDGSSPELSPLAKAHQLASECLTIAIVMVLPGLIAWWLDDHFGTKPVLMLIGFTLGFTYGIWRLARLGTQRQKNFVPKKPYNTEGLEPEQDSEEQEEENELF